MAEKGSKKNGRAQVFEKKIILVPGEGKKQNLRAETSCREVSVGLTLYIASLGGGNNMVLGTLPTPPQPKKGDELKAVNHTVTSIPSTKKKKGRHKPIDPKRGLSPLHTYQEEEEKKAERECGVMLFSVKEPSSNERG